MIPVVRVAPAGSESAWRAKYTGAVLAYRSDTFNGIVSVSQPHIYQPELEIAVQERQKHLHALLFATEGTNV